MVYLDILRTLFSLYFRCLKSYYARVRCLLFRDYIPVKNLPVSIRELAISFLNVDIETTRRIATKYWLIERKKKESMGTIIYSDLQSKLLKEYNGSLRQKSFFYSTCVYSCYRHFQHIYLKCKFLICCFIVVHQFLYLPF